MITSVKNIPARLVTFGAAALHVFIDPLSTLFHKLLGHPELTPYDGSKGLSLHRVSKTVTEFERVAQYTSYFNCFYNREAALKEAASNIKKALFDLRKDLSYLGTSESAPIIKEKVQKTVPAVIRLASSDNREETKREIIEGLRALEPYADHLQYYDKQAFYEITGLAPATLQESQESPVVAFASLEAFYAKKPTVFSPEVNKLLKAVESAVAELEAILVVIQQPASSLEQLARHRVMAANTAQTLIRTFKEQHPAVLRELHERPPNPLAALPKTLLDLYSKIFTSEELIDRLFLPVIPLITPQPVTEV